MAKFKCPTTTLAKFDRRLLSAITYVSENITDHSDSLDPTNQ